MNPNVAIEMGYAIANLGDNKIITVMNTEYGKIEDLPFDLKHKRGPIAFQLKKESTDEKISLERDKLVAKFKDTIISHISTFKDEGKMAANLDEYGKSIYFDPTKPILRRSEGWSEVKDQELFFELTPTYFYIKLEPNDKQFFIKSILTENMFNASQYKIHPFLSSANNTPETNKFGALLVNKSRSNNSKIDDIVQVFKSGHLIGINSSIIKNNNTIPLNYFNKTSIQHILQYMTFLNNLFGKTVNFTIEIGLVNKDGCNINLPNFSDGRIYHENTKGPLEDELYMIRRELSTSETEEVQLLIKDFIVMLFEDLSLKGNYDEHNWS